MAEKTRNGKAKNSFFGSHLTFVGENIHLLMSDYFSSSLFKKQKYVADGQILSKFDVTH